MMPTLAGLGSSSIVKVDAVCRAGPDRRFMKRVPDHVSSCTVRDKSSTLRFGNSGFPASSHSVKLIVVDSVHCSSKGQFVASDVRAGKESSQGNLSSKVCNSGNPKVIASKSLSVNGVAWAPDQVYSSGSLKGSSVIARF
ncbi:hypothetical protein KCU64_g73, partial [Aureobasidium melanogenum]